MFFPLDCKFHQGRKYIDICYGLDVSIALPQIHVAALIPNMMVTGSGAYGRLLGLDEFMRVGPP